MELMNLSDLKTNITMKTTILLFFSLFFVNYTYCQIFGQDKDGFSTIIQPSASFNLDLTDKVATLNFYQENMKSDYNEKQKSKINKFCETEDLCLKISSSKDTLKLETYKKLLSNFWKEDESNSKRRGFLYGIDLKGSSSDGIALLINNEQVMTTSAISGMIGLQWHKNVYCKKILADYAEKNYYYTKSNQDSIEKKLIAKIVIEVQKLAEQKIISEEKQGDLLWFTTIVSNKDKIVTIKKKIISIKEQRNFLDKKYEKNILIKRIATLKELEDHVSEIQRLISDYQTKHSVYNKDQPTVTEAVYTDLRILKDSIKKFKDKLQDETIKPLKLEFDYNEFSTSSDWDKAKNKIKQSRENSGSDSISLAESPEFTEIFLEPLTKAYNEYKLFLKNEKIQFEELQIAKNKSISFQRNLLYFKAGFLGSSFKYDLANESTSIGDRFVTKNFQGYRLELGYTRQFQRYNFLGLNTTMNRTSNAEDLTSTTFKFDKTDTSVVPNITTGTEFKALSGPFDTFFKYGLSFDYVRLIPFHDSNASDKEIKNGKLLLSINPYIRHNFYSNSDTLKPNTSLGLGLYSFNKESGSIAGGIFVQADDLFNKNRTEAINFTKQISVGIVFKVAIKSFDPTAK